jgi:hypothetical protein
LRSNAQGGSLKRLVLSFVPAEAADRGGADLIVGNAIISRRKKSVASPIG